jgi:membrane protease YdiL (CAAX protease family)
MYRLLFLYMAKQRKDEAKRVARPSLNIDHVYQVWGWIALVWAFYRYYVRLPEWADELMFKPLVFAVPVLWFVRSFERRSWGSIGITTKQFKQSIGYGVGLGLVFFVEALAANWVKNGSIVIQPIKAVGVYGALPLVVFTVATAFTEEVLNRGFLFSRIFEQSGRFVYASLISTALFVVLHIPILVTALQLRGDALFLTEYHAQLAYEEN